MTIVYNYSSEGEVNSVDIYEDAKRGSLYQALFTDPEGDSCLEFTKSDG